MIAIAVAGIISARRVWLEGNIQCISGPVRYGDAFWSFYVLGAALYIGDRKIILGYVTGPPIRD